MGALVMVLGTSKVSLPKMNHAAARLWDLVKMRYIVSNLILMIMSL